MATDKNEKHSTSGTGRRLSYQLISCLFEQKQFLKHRIMTYNFHIVALGASAGGIGVIKEFFGESPVNPNIAYIVAVHYPRGFKSQLAHVLSRVAKLEVVTIEPEMPIVSGKIYIHPGSNVSLKDGKFAVSERSPMELINRTVDHLFTSLAIEAKSKVIGIILSGTGSDGVEGLRCIEKYNGFALVQDPDTAEFDGMPLNSIYQDNPHYILHPRKMPLAIEDIIAKGETKYPRAEPVRVPKNNRSK